MCVNESDYLWQVVCDVKAAPRLAKLFSTHVRLKQTFMATSKLFVPFRCKYTPVYKVNLISTL